MLILFSSLFQVTDSTLAPVLRNAIEGMVRALQLRRAPVPEVVEE